MNTGLSNWWSTPSDPAQHFSDEELLASDRYHRPLRRAGVLAITAKVGLLVVGVWLVARPAVGLGTGGGGSERLADAGFFQILTSRSLLVGAGLATVALRLPAIVVDTWFEYRFRHGARPSDSFQPLPPHRFLTTVCLLTLLVWCGFVITGAAVYRLAAGSERWSFLAAGAVVLVVGVVAVAEWPIRRRLPGGPEPLDPRPAEFDRLVTRFGLDHIPVLVGPSGHGPASLAEHHFNAASMGLGPNRRVVVSSGLLGRPSSVQEFVVAHELSHLERRHLLAQTVVTAIAAAASIIVVGAATATDRFGASPGIDLMDPLQLPAVVLLVIAVGAIIGPVTAWLGRAQERVADADAIAAAGPLPINLARQLHAQANTDLDPPRWVRLFAKHPTPAERLEFVERHRRAI